MLLCCNGYCACLFNVYTIMTVINQNFIGKHNLTNNCTNAPSIFMFKMSKKYLTLYTTYAQLLLFFLAHNCISTRNKSVKEPVVLVELLMDLLSFYSHFVLHPIFSSCTHIHYYTSIST